MNLGKLFFLSSLGFGSGFRLFSSLGFGSGFRFFCSLRLGSCLLYLGFRILHHGNDVGIIKDLIPGEIHNFLIILCFKSFFDLCGFGFSGGSLFQRGFGILHRGNDVGIIKDLVSGEIYNFLEVTVDKGVLDFGDLRFQRGLGLFRSFGLLHSGPGLLHPRSDCLILDLRISDQIQNLLIIFCIEREMNLCVVQQL